MIRRVDCKLHEIVSELHGHGSSDYHSSLRDEHRFECLSGKKAYTVDDGVNGTTIFMPWKLHRPLEQVFHKHADNGLMSSCAFAGMVDDFMLFPRFQGWKKKGDIIGYILGRVVKSPEGMGFEDFLYALFLLAKYRAAVLRITEQCSFNHLVSSLILPPPPPPPPPANETLISQNDHKSSEGINVDSSAVNNSTLGKSFEYSGNSAVSSSNSSVSGGNSNGFSEDEITKIAPKSFEKCMSTKIEIKEESVEHIEKAVGSEFEKDKEDRVCMKATEDLITKNHEIMQNEIRLLHEKFELKCELEAQCKTLKSELSEKVVEVEKLKMSLRVAESSLESSKEQLATLEILKKTQEEQHARELANLQRRIDEMESIKKHNQEIQSLLTLQPEHEAKLFSVFLLYKNESLMDGQFVISEEHCIDFCLDFDLVDSDTPNSDESEDHEPMAKRAFKLVSGFCNNGNMCYALFKEFLMHLSQLMIGPQLSPSESFRRILFDLIFLRVSGESPNERIYEGSHPIYIDGFNNPSPWEAPGLASSDKNHANPNDGEYMNVEGKIWFEQEANVKNPHRNDSAQTTRQFTPRF